MKKITLLLLFVLITSLTLLCCKSFIYKETFVQKTEKAHEAENFFRHQAIQFDIILNFGEKERLSGQMTLLTNSSKGLLVFKNGNKIIYDNNKVYYSPEIKQNKNVRFDAYTWSYFFLFPYKLSDQGTVWKKYENKEKDAQDYISQRLTFKSGTGDAPEDWYVVYANKNNYLIKKAAYIVTANSKKEEAEKNPHAIEYKDYKVFDSVPIATQWRFWEWVAGTGLTKEIGNASLSNIKFITVDSKTFKPEADFKTI